MFEVQDTARETALLGNYLSEICKNPPPPAKEACDNERESSHPWNGGLPARFSRKEPEEGRKILRSSPQVGLIDAFLATRGPIMSGPNLHLGGELINSGNRIQFDGDIMKRMRYY